MEHIPRDIEPEVEKWLRSREIIAIRGPRQSGKTTLLKRLESVLNARGVDEKKVHYISFEDDLTRMKFEEDPKEFVEFHMAPKGRHYFLLDEVQYVKEAGKKLKVVFDSFNNAKLIISGSSSFDLTNLGSYLVGRIIFFNLYPFSFSEFLRAKGEKYERLHKSISIDLRKENIRTGKTVFLNDLNKFLHEYLTFGSYPRIVTEGSRDKKKELLKNMFTTYVEKDIVALYGIKHREKAVRLLKTVSSILGNVISYETLSENSGLKYHEVREILPLLEDSFIIFVVKPFYKNLLNEIRKNPKIYFMDFGIRNYLTENFENPEFAPLYENFVHNELKRHYQVKYWRTTARTEVDFIVEYKKEIIPVEVKTKPKITRSFRSFIHSYKPEKALILNLNAVDKTRIDNCNTFIVPFAHI